MTDGGDDRPAATAHMVDYDQNSSVQNRAIAGRATLLARLVEATGPVEPEFRIIDLGCGPGHSAIAAVRPTIDAYRAIAPDGPLVVCHSDQPGNDWNFLLALAFGPEGYHSGEPTTRTETSVGSFYEERTAPGAAALATCFAASHWSSRAIHPDAPGTVWFADLEGTAREEMAALARADWATFLSARARELRPGGHLVVSTLGGVPDPAEPHGVLMSGRDLYRAIGAVLQTMADDGTLDAAALDSFVFPLWFPTLEDALAPLRGDTDLAAVFEVVEADVEALAGGGDPYIDAVGEPQRYAALYTGYVRGFADSSLRLHLFERATRDAAGVDALAAEFYRRFERLYREEPGRHASRTFILTLALKRR